MTAMNLIVQPSARASFLLTDTAIFERGRVVRFERKLVEFALASGHAVMAVSGLIEAVHFAEHAAKLAGATIDEFLAAAPAMFADVERAVLADGKHERCGHSRMAVAIATYDPARGAGGYLISNVLNLSREPGYRPHALVRTRRHLTECAVPVCSPDNMANPRQWNPLLEGGALLQVQRADPFESHGIEYVGIGGQGILTRVDANGVSHATVAEWPDRAGRYINLAGPPPSAIGIVASRLSGLRRAFARRSAVPIPSRALADLQSANLSTLKRRMG